MAGENRLAALALRLKKAELQNRLMRLTDRELALVLIYMQDPERAVFFAPLPESKRDRVKEELELLKRKRIDPARHRNAVDRTSDILSGRRGGEISRGFFKRSD